MELCGIDTTHRQHPVLAIPPTRPENRLKMSVSEDPTVGWRLNVFTSFLRLFSMELRGIGTTRRRCSVKAIPLKGPEYLLKKFVSKDPTVGSRSNCFTCFWMLLSMELRGIGTTRPRRPVWAIPPTRLEYRLKMFVSKDPTVASRSNFFTCFRRFFPWSCVESTLHADGVRSRPFHRKDQSAGLKSP